MKTPRFIKTITFLPALAAAYIYKFAAMLFIYKTSTEHSISTVAALTRIKNILQKNYLIYLYPAINKKITSHQIKNYKGSRSVFGHAGIF